VADQHVFSPVFCDLIQLSMYPAERTVAWTEKRDPERPLKWFHTPFSWRT